MGFKMKFLTALAAVAFTASANAATMYFNNGSGSYTESGVTGTATTTGGSLFYNGVENAIGVGSNVFDGALAQGETLKIDFGQSIKVNKVYFRQWENPFIVTYDKVKFDYDPGGDLTWTNSGQGVTLLDSFSTGGIDMNSFTLLPQNGVTAIYLHSIDFDVPVTSEVPVPAAVWLFGSALFGLFGVARRRSAKA